MNERVRTETEPAGGEHHETTPADFIDVIRSRRSVRGRYESTPVPDDVVTEIIECGLRAPSSKNAQPWRIHEVSGDTLSEIAALTLEAKGIDSFVPQDNATGERQERYSSTVPESAEVLNSVPLGLFVENVGPFSGGINTVAEVPEDFRKDAMVGYTLEIIGIGAAVENMYLAARSQGLEGVFMGDVLIAKTEIETKLGMTGDLMGVLALGYATETPPEKSSSQLLDDKVVRHGQGVPLVRSGRKE